ncbi:peroxisomal biogenesis factor 19 [Plakobranchus ocellatus]|uniref:Peroxin-19 n=1 Tax=Plakobranchus ocellatus TaxID=259542 RepID=A0AAV4B942_9GAST|nr:peroxisomal biogenesis factor 19 [Plakobranchus ocellatus]
MASTDDSQSDKSKDQSSSVDVSLSGKPKSQNDVDPELEAILDSALADFDKPKENQNAKSLSAQAPEGSAGAEAKVASEADKDKTSSSKQTLNPEDGLPEELNYDFLSDAMGKQFENTFTALMNDPNLKKQFEDLAGSAEQAASSNNAAAFAETVEQALSGLNLNAENLQGDPNQQELWEQLAETFGAGAEGMPGAGLEGAEEGLGAVSGMFQGMVKQLLSKELLYQPLKEVSEKYKEYLKDHPDLPGEKLTQYRAQLEIIEKVVEHLDGESSWHSLEEKNARFEVLLDLLQRMHELGNPPTEVVGEGNMMVPNFAELGNLGQLPNLGNLASGTDPSQCSVM